MTLSELTKMYDFTGRSVIITGGTGVLCSAMAAALTGCGAGVAILSRNKKKGDTLAASVPGPGRAISLRADVLNRDELRRAANRVQKEFGHIDCLINGAGGNHPSASTGPDSSFFDLPEEALKAVFDLNLLGSILPAQVFGREMARRGEGVILNISSMSAIRPLTRVMAYSAAKSAISSFTQWLAVHLASEYSPRLRVNALAPGFFLTEQNRFLLLDKQTGELSKRGHAIIDHTPMGRFGAPEDLLGAMLWLLSPASAFVTGIVVPVDGGFSAFGGV